MKAMGRFDGILEWGVELEIIGDWGEGCLIFLDGCDGCDEVDAMDGWVALLSCLDE